MANDTIFGLAAYFYARDLSRVTKVSEALEDGIVGINTGLISTELAPFGGVKQSGLGREGSRHGMDEFMEMRSISAFPCNALARALSLRYRVRGNPRCRQNCST